MRMEMETIRQGWHEWRDGLFRRLADALTDDYVAKVEESRAIGRYDTPRMLSAELEVGKGLIVAQWKPGREARADAWGDEEHLPRLSLWLSEALSRHGYHRIEESARKRMDESDREGKALRDTEEALLYSNMWF